MKAIELLEKYPLSTELVRNWFIQKMIESVKGDNEVPEDFRNFMLEKGIDNDRMSVMIDGNPRILFDVFDANNIIIQILFLKDDTFSHKILSVITTNCWKTRKEAEISAIEAAFDILENQLKPVSDDSNITADSEDN